MSDTGRQQRVGPTARQRQEAERRLEIEAHLQAAYTHLEQAKDLEQGDTPYDYDADPIVPETEDALAISQAVNWVWHLLHPKSRREEQT